MNSGHRKSLGQKKRASHDNHEYGTPGCEPPPDPISAEAISRREFLHSTSMACAATLISNLTPAHAKGGDDDAVTTTPALPPSPPTTPWLMTLPEDIEFLKPCILEPRPECEPNTDGGECGRPQHQLWELFYFENPTTYPTTDDSSSSSDSSDDDNIPAQPRQSYEYELYAVEMKNWTFHPDYPAQRIWGYQYSDKVADYSKEQLQTMMSSTPIMARYGHPVMVRLYNYLPHDHQGPGSPDISMHLHNLHAASESDGYAGDYFSEEIFGPTLNAAGKFKDHLYPNLPAGFNTPGFGAEGDPTEALGTLFYHDHTLDYTAANVVNGLAGFYLLFDQIDSGDENDPGESALRLPSGKYDYPFSIGERRFDEKGMLYFDQLSPEGTLGDKILINNRIEPVWNVVRRRYRMRLLNSGPSRSFDLAIVNESNQIQSFVYIANDGNLLPAPLLNTKSVRLGVAERADIIFDFSKIGVQDKEQVLYLVDRLEYKDTRKADKFVTPGKRIMKIVIRPGFVSDPSVVLTADKVLRPLPKKFNLTIDEIKRSGVKVRRWVFARNGGAWTVNDKIFNVNKAVATIKRGTAEIWELVNSSGGWTHPVHIHLEEARVLSKIVDGKSVAIPPHERGRKDVFVLEPSSSTTIYIEFRDFTGKYMMHCHNLPHEDHAMMIRWDIEA